MLTLFKRTLVILLFLFFFFTIRAHRHHVSSQSAKFQNIYGTFRISHFSCIALRRNLTWFHQVDHQRPCASCFCGDIWRYHTGECKRQLVLPHGGGGRTDCHSSPWPTGLSSRQPYHILPHSGWFKSHGIAFYQYIIWSETPIYQLIKNYKTF